MRREVIQPKVIKLKRPAVVSGIIRASSRDCLGGSGGFEEKDMRCHLGEKYDEAEIV